MKKCQMMKRILNGKNFYFGKEEVFNSQIFYEGAGRV
jgi:hypothetical protein